MDIKVSIIVPIYNSEKNLGRCIDSLINQTLQEIEILLINDGSNDKSGLICEKYASKDSRIHYIYQKNAGVSAARNHGLDIAYGEYVMFCDSDDYYERDAAELLYVNGKQNDADWIIGSVEKEFLGNLSVASVETQIVSKNHGMIELLAKLTKNYMHYQLWGKLYCRAIIDENHLRMREEMSCGEDYEWICRFVQRVHKIATVNKVVYHYYVTDTNSLSQRFNRMYFQNIEKQYQAAKELFLKLDAWEKYGDIIMEQQAQNIVSGYGKAGMKTCSLSLSQKLKFLDEGRHLQSLKEYRLQKKVHMSRMKEILLRIDSNCLLYLYAKIKNIR